MSGFREAFQCLVKPALRHRFPELVNASADSVDPEATVELIMFLPTRGREWMISHRWYQGFRQMLAS